MKPLYFAFALTIPCHAAVNFTLPGASENAAWTNLTSSQYNSAAGFPSYGTANEEWPNALTPDIGSSLDATLNKMAGGGYFTASSLYTGFTPGSFQITNLNSMADLETVIFQAHIGLLLGSAPVLSYNGGSQQIAADFSGATDGGLTIPNFDGTITHSSNQIWQWDLSGVAVPITEYTIDWGTTTHGTVYDLRLTEGDTFVQVVPEPSIPAFSLLSASLLILRRRRA